MKSDTQHDWDWANQYMPEAFSVLKQNANFLVSFEIAPRDIDLKEVGDIVFSSNMGHVAFRVRRPGVAFRDLTLRYRRSSGAQTEIHKIRSGFGRWYLYAWADGKMPNGNGKFKDWILIDLDQFRDCGLAFEDRIEKANDDKATWFYAYSDDELELYQCIVAKHNDRLRKNGHARWTTWDELKREYPTVLFAEIQPDSVTIGDFYQFENGDGHKFIAEIVNLNGEMVQVGSLSWVELFPKIGKATVYRKGM